MESVKEHSGDERCGVFASFRPVLVSLALSASCMTAGHAAEARIVETVEGDDWRLPPYVKLTPYSGYITWGRAWAHKRSRLDRYKDGHIHFATYLMIPWNKINPAEGVYDWDFVDRKIRQVTSVPGNGYIFWIINYSKTHPNWRPEKPQWPAVPPWVADKGDVKFLSNGAVAAWEPGCGYQKYYGRMIRALGERYRNDPKLVAVDMRALDCRHGEWCWRDGMPALKEAETRTGLTPEAFRSWGLRFLDDFLEGFKGQERKLVWVNGGKSFIWAPGKMKHDYGPASRELWRRAYEAGCGGRDGHVEFWNRYLNEGHGMRVTEERYLEVIEGFPPLRNGAMWYTENEEYSRGRERKLNSIRWFVSCMRALQMRRNWMCISGGSDRHESLEELEERDPAFVRWMELSFGKTATTSADAWAWLREGYLGYWAKNRPIKNFERWLIQRDVAPDGGTLPAARVNLGDLARGPIGKDHEFHARRTDRASGSSYVYFRADRAFVSGGPYQMWLKVTYLDGPPTEWCIEYLGKRGAARTPRVETTGSGRWRTATFAIRDMRFARTFRGQMDFRIAALGPSDVTVKLVRLVKLALSRGGRRERKPVVPPEGTDIVIAGGQTSDDTPAERPAKSEEAGRVPVKRPVRKAPAEEAPGEPEEPADLGRLLKRAETLFIDGEFEKAGELFREIVEQAPESASAAKAREYLEILE